MDDPLIQRVLSTVIQDSPTPVSFLTLAQDRLETYRQARRAEKRAQKAAQVGKRVLLQGLGSRARIRWVDLVTRPIRTPCGSAASARPRRPSPSIAPVPCGAHA